MRKKTWNKAACLMMCTMLAGAVVGAGCGDDEGAEFGSELAGTYRVVSQTENQQACDVEGESTLTEQTPKYFRLKSENFFGQKFVAFTDCDTPAECEEDDAVHLGSWMFTEKRDDHWFGEPMSSSSPGSVDDNGQVECSLSLVRVKAFVDGPNVRMEQRTSYGSAKVAEDKCEPELAVAELGEGSCERYVVLTGTTDY